ncbi:MAG: hypothetical protein D6715_00825 [Calditrichaeota bacterium]|nr:MAG: hypothetical protein D6715_00825 [Calditrichota bacterium]
MSKLVFLLDRQTAPMFRLTGWPVHVVSDPAELPDTLTRLQEQGVELFILSERLASQLPADLWQPGSRGGPWIVAIPGIGDPGVMIRQHLLRLRARAVGGGESDNGQPESQSGSPGGHL